MPFLSFRVYNCCFNNFRATIASWCHSSTFSCSQLFGDHLAAVRWNSRWPARSARSAASRRPPKPPKRPHCHLTRFLSWLCVRCAQQPRKFVWRLRIDADIKKTYTQTKPFFEPTFRIKWSQLLHLPRMNKQKQKNASPRLGDWWNTIPKMKSSKFESPIQP